MTAYELELWQAVYKAAHVRRIEAPAGHGADNWHPAVKAYHAVASYRGHFEPETDMRAMVNGAVEMAEQARTADYHGGIK